MCASSMFGMCVRERREGARGTHARCAFYVGSSRREAQTGLRMGVERDVPNVL